MSAGHIYISGPMRTRDGFNFPAFFEAEVILRDAYPEAEICNPAREDIERFGLEDLLYADSSGLMAGRYLVETAEFGTADLRQALGRDLDFICQKCDLLVLLPGWEESRGAKAERAAAEALDIAIEEMPEQYIRLMLRRLGWVRGSHSGSDDQSPTETPNEAPGADSVASGGQFRPDLRPDLIAKHLGEVSQTSGEPDEVRLTSATGGQKGTKLAAFSQVSPEVEWLVAEHFGKGARKYEAHNFRQGYSWSLSYDALRRHLAEFWMGKEYDVCSEHCARPEPRGESEHGPICFNHTGSLHIVAVIWHAMVLTEFYLHQKEYDDRYVYPSH